MLAMAAGRVKVDCGCVLGESFALSLEQAVTGLGALELGFHQAQGLACGKHGLAILIPTSVMMRLVGWLRGSRAKNNLQLPPTSWIFVMQAGNK